MLFGPPLEGYDRIKLEAIQIVGQEFSSPAVGFPVEKDQRFLQLTVRIIRPNKMDPNGFKTLDIYIYTGLGICSLDFRANCAFF